MDQSKPWIVLGLGIVCAIVALYLIFTLLSTGGFFAWIWKLPTAIFAVMAAIQFIDVGVNGDQPPR